MEGISEDMWTPYKNLFKTIQQTLMYPSGTSASTLEMCLKKHKQTFASILRNPPKNERSRTQLRNGLLEGVTLSGHKRTMILSKELVDESLIISDMFDLDEYIALELLCTAQNQISQHPGLPRGLIAILLYYDGRKAIAYSLRDLFQMTTGVSWDTDLPKEISFLISSFTKSLVDDTNILERLLIILLEQLDIVRETDLLTKNRAFGSKKHQNQVLELFEDTRLALAMCIFNWSAQRGLPKSIVIKLIHAFSKDTSMEASGSLDDVTVTLFMALLYSYDTSILQHHEDNNIFVQNLPVMNDSAFLADIFETFTSDHLWGCKNSLINVSKFAFGLSLASLRHVSQTISNSHSKTIEYDEQLIDDAILGKTFELLHYYVLENDIIFKNPFFYRRIHMMFTDFIDYMHSKVTELRGRADETARIVMSFSKEGLEPPANLDHNFEMLMLCIGKFYKDDRAGLSLCIEYWGPLDTISNYHKSTTRSVSLFKFIRLAGELLPTTLFVPYLKMIAGLTSCERSARNAFNLLKQASGLSGSSTLSWEHFFGSLNRYYSNLRQEHCPESDTIYKSRAYNRSINPLEIEGLRAVLGVIKAVTTYDEIARIAICEHPNWTPFNVLLGLLSCSVPLCLKADILNTLSALAKSKETAISLWTFLEISNVIPTTDIANSYNTCDLQVEIDQNESRIECYPISRGVLDLLYSLTTSVIPKNLGAGPRKSGYDPYLNFVINGIFLKFYNRTYKDIAEKWEVAEKCLKLLHYLIKSYEIKLQDFAEQCEQNPHPGYHIMLQLHTKSDMLRLILLIIDEVRIHLDEYNKFRGKEVLEKCGLHCLNILEIALSKQNDIFYAHSAANSSKMLSGLNKLLLDVNPRSRQPDQIFIITKFITYFNWLPHHALTAVKILCIVSKLPKVSLQMLGMFTQSDLIQNEIRQGFVDCLETDVKMVLVKSHDKMNEFEAEMKVEIEIKEAIIELLQNCLVQPLPNLSHFLLGLDTTRGGPHANQKQKLVESNSNCTKSLISLLDNHMEMMKTTNGYDADIERIIDRSYYLLYSLCANQDTSDIILRYLRSCNDFIFRHLASFPFQNNDRAPVLSQMSYLLKCTAIELKVAATNCQISRYQHLFELLAGTYVKGANNIIPIELNHCYSHTSNLLEESSLNVSEKPSNLLLCHLLDCIKLEPKNQPKPHWEFFDNALTGQIFKECEIETASGPKLINIKKLHEILTDELRIVQSTIASGQRKLILLEIESVLRYALQINDERNINFATAKLMEAWGQVSEILIACAPKAVLTTAMKQEFILEILHKILCKVVPIQAGFELSVLSSSTVLLLVVNLRYYFLQNEGYTGSNNDNFVESQKYSKNLFASKSNSLNLKYILKSLLEWIIVSSVTSQKLRINLYAALLNLLFIVKQKDIDKKSENSTKKYVSRLDGTITNTFSTESNQIRMSAEIFLSFGEKLMEVICHDCIAGHDICKMLALSCINALLELNYMSGFIHFFSNRGYLCHITESVMKSDDSLCNVLSSTPEMKSLYMYESKMATLIRIAGSHTGAELLLAEKILVILSDMKVYDMHPDFQGTYRKIESNEFIPNVDERFRQILFPALNLCNCLISTLGSENHSLIAQVSHFLLSHCDMIEIILRTGTPFMNLGLLQELSAITSLLAVTTNQEMFSHNEKQDISVNFFRIQQLMLSTFSRFLVSESIFKEMLKIENLLYEPSEFHKSLHVKYFLEISANCTLYCRNVVANHSADHRANGILFSPNVTDNPKRSENSTTVVRLNQSLYVILDQLKGSVDYYNSQHFVIDSLCRQKSSLPNIDYDICAQSTFSDLTMRCSEKQNDLVLCKFIIQQSLYLLWSHLDFYIRCTYMSRSGNLDITQSASMLDNLYGLMISQEDISCLKKSLIGIFNETFCKKLLEMSSLEMDKGFNEAILRRIKSLVQFIPIN